MHINNEPHIELPDQIHAIRTNQFRNTDLSNISKTTPFLHNKWMN
uniref:Uncharacterized protein n=1 Tax=Arundo donax TaxID=35708 RepID=A0A0A8Y5U1_ARUDO